MVQEIFGKQKIEKKGLNNSQLRADFLPQNIFRRNMDCRYSDFYDATLVYKDPEFEQLEDDVIIKIKYGVW